MTHPVQSLQRELDHVLDLLDHGSFYSLTAEEGQSLRGDAKALSKKVAATEGSFLTLGLLGGTGVGKSTLMNALAGSEIASTSHRRPHTDEVLIYRYVEAKPLPSLSLTDVPWREITHQGSDIRQILLCDLPDFDSLMGEHRQYVFRFLEHLDVLVWVTSPEKYADGRFYEFLQTVPKAKQNFYFVLNKLDLFFRDEGMERGYEQMASVTKRFQEHIKENGIAEPLFWALSAKEVLDSDQPAPWNQFPSFRQQIFQQRDIKQITAIKAANLDVEVQDLLLAFKKEVLNLEAFEGILEGSIKELEQQRSPWMKAGQQTIDTWLEKHVSQQILSCQGDPSLLVGPGYGVAVLFQGFHKRFAEEKHIPRSSLSPLILPEAIKVSFQRRVKWVADRLNRRILRHNLPASFQEGLQDILNVPKKLEDLEGRLTRLVSLLIAKPSLPSFWGFRALQFMIYALLLTFFLLAIGGETAWLQVLDAPGGNSVVRLLLSGISTLFSAKGLAALGSYALINLFFAFRFYRRYRTLLQKAADKMIESLKVRLGKVWEEELDTIMGELNEFREDIRSKASAVSALTQERREI